MTKNFKNIFKNSLKFLNFGSSDGSKSSKFNLRTNSHEPKGSPAWLSSRSHVAHHFDQPILVPTGLWGPIYIGLGSDGSNKEN